MGAGLMAFNYNTWGTSWGHSWLNSWGVTVAPVVVTVDKHDGQKKRNEERKQAGERLRAQIRMAIDGPEASTIIPALETVAAQGPGALELRVDMDELLRQVEVWRAVRAAADAYARREREIDEDDEEVLTLL